MRVLQICNKPPYPPVDGGCLAMHSITEGLTNEGVNVTVLAINTPKHTCDPNNLPTSYLEKTAFKTAFVNTRINPVSIFLNFFSNTPYNIQRFYSKKFEQLIISVLKENEFDIIQFESLYVIPYLAIVKKYSNAKFILRAHNVEHQLWERRSMEEKNILKKYYLNLLASRIKKHETAAINNVDAVVTITHIDETYFKKITPKGTFLTIPFGIDIEKYSHFPSHASLATVFFIGALDWKPNIDGLLWFIKNVWQNISKQLPGTKIHIAGKNTPQKIKNLSSGNIQVDGEVPDALEYMSRHNIMIAPLFSGGGMRIKIIEAMAMGKVVITTTMGAEGIPCKNGENILIADTREDFSKRLIESIGNQEQCNTIGNNAKQFAFQHYDNKILSKKLIAFYNHLITSKKP